jgi:hypothetical protein
MQYRAPSCRRTPCTRPSRLRRFARHCDESRSRCHRGNCRAFVCGTRVRHANTDESPDSRHTSTPANVGHQSHCESSHIHQCEKRLIKVPYTDPEGDLEILATPHLHALVIGTDIVEELPVDCEQAARDRRRPATRHKSRRKMDGRRKAICSTYSMGFDRS